MLTIYNGLGVTMSVFYIFFLFGLQILQKSDI